MSAVVNLKNVTISENAKVLNNASVSSSEAISLEDVKIAGHAVVLENLNISELCDAVQNACSIMEPEEYASIQSVMAQKKGDQQTFLSLLRQHLINFAEGVTASIVASVIMR